MAPDPAVDRLRSDAEDVETELAQLAADGGPLRRELARIAGRLVATEAWAELGFARLGDYGRECVGLSARELHELARVDARLGETVAYCINWKIRVVLVTSKAFFLCRSYDFSVNQNASCGIVIKSTNTENSSTQNCLLRLSLSCLPASTVDQ